MRVIDACAGAGGKTLHIAAMMQGKGRLLAMDVEEWKLENLKQRARRAGAHNVETRVITSSKTVKRLKESADRVLLDVPCSGLGVLKRNPDAKWRDTAERLPVLVALQEEILQRYSQMVKSAACWSMQPAPSCPRRTASRWTSSSPPTKTSVCVTITP